jgi:hypothetical protein
MSKQVAIDFQLAQQSTHVMLATKSKTNENTVFKMASQAMQIHYLKVHLSAVQVPFLNKMNVLKVWGSNKHEHQKLIAGKTSHREIFLFQTAV